jgi:hypothetical protein
VTKDETVAHLAEMHGTDDADEMPMRDIVSLHLAYHASMPTAVPEMTPHTHD